MGLNEPLVTGSSEAFRVAKGVKGAKDAKRWQRGHIHYRGRRDDKFWRHYSAGKEAEHNINDMVAPDQDSRVKISE
jgi:hypothetical protein